MSSLPYAVLCWFFFLIFKTTFFKCKKHFQLMDYTKIGHEFGLQAVVYQALFQAEQSRINPRNSLEELLKKQVPQERGRYGIQEIGTPIHKRNERYSHHAEEIFQEEGLEGNLSRLEEEEGSKRIDSKKKTETIGSTEVFDYMKRGFTHLLGVFGDEFVLPAQKTKK